MHTPWPSQSDTWATGCYDNDQSPSTRVGGLGSRCFRQMDYDSAPGVALWLFPRVLGEWSKDFQDRNDDLVLSHLTDGCCISDILALQQGHQVSIRSMNGPGSFQNISIRISVVTVNMVTMWRAFVGEPVIFVAETWGWEWLVYRLKREKTVLFSLSS